MSKKLLVFSDSHGSISALKIIFNWAKNLLPPSDSLCAAACLGDGLADIQKAADASGFFTDWKVVSGNNDYGIQAPESAVFDFSGHRFYICHGHRHGIYGGLHTLLSSAKKNNADTALFGHTHVPFYKYSEGVSIINPGSVSRPRSRIGATFAVIECIEGEPLVIRFFGISDRGSIREINF